MKAIKTLYKRIWKNRLVDVLWISGGNAHVTYGTGHFPNIGINLVFLWIFFTIRFKIILKLHYPDLTQPNPTPTHTPPQP